MLLLTVSLFASFCLGVTLDSPLASKHLARKRAGSENVQEAQLECAVCPEDIDTDGGVATLAFVQGSDDGITMCMSVFLCHVELPAVLFSSPYVATRRALGRKLFVPT